MEILINKSTNKLRLADKQRVVFEFPCHLGKNPGRKLKRDDMKTPEGEYKIVVKNPKSEYHLSLGLNYPNLQDANDAFESNIINQTERDKIISGHKNNFIPWDTPMGGEIYIHGDSNADNHHTRGCIKLKDADMEKLYESAKIGESVIIKAT